MNKNNCKVGQNVAYFPSRNSDDAEFGVVTELRDQFAMVQYEGSTISKATYYSDIEPEPETLISIGKK